MYISTITFNTSYQPLSPITLHIEAGILAIGLQECKDKEWLYAFTENISKDMKLIDTANLGSIYLAVWSSLPFKNVSKHTKATGIARVGTNKGGVSIAFTDDMSGERITFVNSHLCAHPQYVDRRNADFNEISLGLPKSDLTVWMGDLNYRLDADPNGDRSKVPNENVFNAVFDMIRKRKYTELFQTDQLKKEMQNYRVFQGYKELLTPPPFAPTFKYYGKLYNRTRLPAWCDRILYKGENVKTKIYKSMDLFSDHQAVMGVIDYNPPSSRKLISIKNLSAAKLKAKDLSGSSDPYVIITGDDEKVKTVVIQKSLNPIWHDELSLRSNFPLRVEIYDYDVLGNDDLIGEGVIKQNGYFQINLMSNDFFSGTLTGVVEEK